MSSCSPLKPTEDMTTASIDLLRSWLKNVLEVGAARWLDDEIDRQHNALDERRLGIALGLVGRKLPRSNLSLSSIDIASAQALRSGWRPDTWRTDEAARVALVLATWRGEKPPFAASVDRLCATGELTEHVACVKGFAIFPSPEGLTSRARKAVRSSIQPLFEAIACQNPYPADYFDEAAYNQMIVKCVFSDIPIETVVGLADRRNKDLVRMLRDLVSERHAAGRTVPEPVLHYIDSI
jgi:hypothetical protein